MAVFDDFQGFLDALSQPAVMVEAGVIFGCVALAWLVAHWFRRDPDTERSVWTSQRAINSVLFPILALLFVWVARWALMKQSAPVLMRLAVPLLASLVVVRTAARGLRAAFPDSHLVRSVERSFSWVVWGAMVLWVTGLLPHLMQEADGIRWTMGGSPVSLRSLIEGALSAGAVMVAALWVSSLVEARLLSSPHAKANVSLRKIAANGTRALLLILGVMFALTAAGIPLGALGVLGGAIGVGVGFGLQKLAANYVSGFVILAERSLRIGDVVKVDGFEGRITDIATRYTVVRALDGRESIVPNEMLITQRVENHSLADRRVALTTSVQVAYGTDLAMLLPQLELAVAGVERVVADPEPKVQLREFAPDGLGLQMTFWIADPENGQGNVRSAVNLAILDVLQSRGVDIPFPQRVVTVVSERGEAGQGGQGVQGAVPAAPTTALSTATSPVDRATSAGLHAANPRAHSGE